MASTRSGPRGWAVVAQLAVAVATLALAADRGSEAPGPAGPGTASDEVIYGVVAGLWRRDGESAAGAVRRQLPRLADLGVTVLWLWPPVNQREEGEEYAVTDFTAVDPSWGGEGELRGLVDAAHARGLRVIVDVVANHTSRDHPWFRTADDPGDPTWDHYERDPDGAPTHYFDWSHLPNLDLDQPAVRRHLIDAMTGLVRRLGIDGFRLDAAWGPARRSPGFWPEVVDRVRRIDPDALFLAEAAAGAAWITDAGIDLAYDWTGGLGQASWADLWTGDGAAEAAAALTRPVAGPPPLRLVDTNDSGERVAAVHGPEVARLAAVLELTVPGTPLVFAGQETGVAFEPYQVEAEGPAGVEGRVDPGLTALYRRLIDLRAAHPALRSPVIEDVRARGDLLTYGRPAPGGDGRIVVALNLGADDVRLDVDPASDVLVWTAPGGPPTAPGPRLRLPGRSAVVLRI